MNYVKADQVLPAHLLKQVRHYLSQGLLYIPAEDVSKKGWGQNNGTRQQLNKRNENIQIAYRQHGRSIQELAAEYYLSEASIKKILYKKS